MKIAALATLLFLTDCTPWRAGIVHDGWRPRERAYPAPAADVAVEKPDEADCPGGRIKQQQRNVDVRPTMHGPITRSTTTRYDGCLE